MLLLLRESDCVQEHTTLLQDPLVPLLRRLVSSDVISVVGSVKHLDH